MLTPVDEVFVCEMGAKQKGDIDELWPTSPPHDWRFDLDW